MSNMARLQEQYPWPPAPNGKMVRVSYIRAVDLAELTSSDFYLILRDHLKDALESLSEDEVVKIYREHPEADEIYVELADGRLYEVTPPVVKVVKATNLKDAMVERPETYEADDPQHKLSLEDRVERLESLFAGYDNLISEITQRITEEDTHA